MQTPTLHAGRYFPANHARTNGKSLPSEAHRKADRVRDIRWFTAQLIRTLVSHGNLEGITLVWEYKFIRGKTHRDPVSGSNDIYIDIHLKNGQSHSTKLVGITRGVYEKVEQMMYLHRKQRQYTKSRQQRLIKEQSSEQAIVTAYHVFHGHVQRTKWMNIREVLLRMLGEGELRKIQWIAYPWTESKPKEYSRYTQIKELIDEIKSTLQDDVDRFEGFSQLKRKLGKIITILKSNDDRDAYQKAKKLLEPAMNWMKDGIIYIHEVAQYIQKGKVNSALIDGWGWSNSKEDESLYEWLTRDESERYDDEYISWISEEEARERNLEEWGYEMSMNSFDPTAREEYIDVENNHIRHTGRKREKESEYSDHVDTLTKNTRKITWLYDAFIRQYNETYSFYPKWWTVVDHEFDALMRKIDVIKARSLYYQEYKFDEIMKEIDAWFLWLIDESLCPLWEWIKNLGEDPIQIKKNLISKYVKTFS